MPNWSESLSEATALRQQHEHAAREAPDTVRRKYLKAIHTHTGRNVIAYYSGWLSKPEFIAGSDINDEDTNGFMATIHQLDRTLGLDLILHTPGGGIASAISIVHYLKTMFGNNIRAIVPQLAMSAGTMVACACKEILMAKHSQLGPTDPQIAGIAAAGVTLEFKRACREVKKDPDSIPMWQAIIGQYAPTFLSQCEQAVSRTRKFVRDQLAENMFSAEPEADRRSKARRIAQKLTDFRQNKAHDRPLFIDDCQQLGLKVSPIEGDPTLQDVVLSAHHCYMHGFMNGPAYKIIENHNGVAVVRLQLPVQRGP